MNNIEKLAIEHLGLTNLHAKELENLEAFAKALQSSEPVLQLENGQILWSKMPSEYTGYLYTQAPASVPKAQYDKLLDALKYYAETAHIYDKDNFSYYDPRQVAIKAIAEAELLEGKEE